MRVATAFDGARVTDRLLVGGAIGADEAWGMIKRVRPHVESFDVPAYRHSCLLALAGYTVNAVPESLPPHVAALYRRAP